MVVEVKKSPKYEYFDDLATGTFKDVRPGDVFLSVMARPFIS